jgi:glyoxylase-like metal-dependent hydrolase (beta-lactamase superfamily II)
MSRIITFPGVSYDCNSYLIIDEKILLIDTGTGSDEKLAEKVFKTVPEVDLIVNTHAHLDHVGGNKLFTSDVALHRDDVEELERGSLYGTSELFGQKAMGKADLKLKDGDVIRAGELTLEVIHTPGHTPGGVCLLSNKGHLFSGDTLFSGGSFGRTDLSGGSSEDLIDSLERLKSETFEFLMPGHMNCVEKGKAHLNAAIELIGEMYERI